MDNCPPGAANDLNAPYNQVDTPEKEFEHKRSIAF